MIHARFSFGLAGLLSASLWLAPAARAQDAATDAAMQANQAAMMAAQQANDAAMMAAQQANDAAMQANQMAMQQSMDAASAGPWCCGMPLAASPHFSLKAGSYKKPVTVRLTDRTWGAVIYYTTDGWTPTAASPRYTGPITLSSTTTLQAIAIAPNCSGSFVASAKYTFPAAAPPASSLLLPALPAGNGVWRMALDAAVPLVFTAPVTSETAQVGDPVSLQLAEDLKAGDTVLAPKGTPATGKIIQVDHPAMGGMPGQIVFEVTSLTVHGEVIPLRAAETLLGKPRVNKARGFALIPFVGIGALAVHGQNAQIPPGATVTATLAAGTMLPAPTS